MYKVVHCIVVLGVGVFTGGLSSAKGVLSSYMIIVITCFISIDYLFYVAN